MQYSLRFRRLVVERTVGIFSMNVLKGFSLFAVLCLALFTFCPVTTAVAQSDEEVIDEIVAVVGEYIVLRSEVDGIVLRFLQQQQMEYSEELWLTALNQLIDQRVLSIHAKRDTNIVVSDDQVEQALDQRIDQITAQMGGVSNLEQIYGKSTLEIRSDLREDLRDQLLADQFQGTKIGSIKTTPSEIREWFMQFPTDSLPTIPEIVRLSHIVRYPTLSDEAKDYARSLVSSIRDSVLAGSFTLEEAATAFSQDEGSKSNGGRYEGSRLRELVPEFAAVASRANIGELSQVFESPYGFHVLRVNERRGDVVDFNHVLIQIDENEADPTEAIDMLSVVRDSILNQEMPFELMARRHSEEEISNKLGGRVLNYSSGERDLPLQALNFTWRTTINSIDIGEISEPAEVELLDGKKAYHIIHLQRRVPEHKVDIETDYERIETLALQDKQNRVLSEWLQDLRKDVYIEMRGKAQEISLAVNGKSVMN